MKAEVASAVNFIIRLLRVKGLLSEEQLQHFSRSLEEALGEHYKDHWFPDAPFRGSGYRCIRINHKMDPLVGKAAYAIGLSRKQLLFLLPCELTMWVDPYEVSYRIGENGSIGVLYESTPPTETPLISVDSCKEKLRLGHSMTVMTVSS
ncbi:hypothetical protein AMELA_G00008610 [Ameiurus melas]|uniref:Anti-proliferative protein domain-containing protein n=1 Tax=Ameiurus melas TaxID=219545 RepID=A0A7J6BGY6_AMEME|nr:hypothetical protein AMELA_G00008610 [Ameiurus melas]